MRPNETVKTTVEASRQPYDINYEPQQRLTGARG
jgi:hypothetical protein